VRLTTDTRLLVATEGRVGRVGVIAVGPDATGLDGATHAVGDVAVAAPDAGTEAIERVVADSNRFFFGLEGGHGQHRAEDLLLEDAHLVVALEDGRFDVEATGQVARQMGAVAAGQALGAFFLTQLEVGLDLGDLFHRRLRTHHGVGVERVAVLDRLDAGDAAVHELVVDRFVNECARRAGADFALVERKQHQTLDRLVEEAVVVVGYIGEEDVGRLAAKFQRGRDQVVGSSLTDQATCAGGAGEGDLVDAGARGQRVTGFATVAVDDVEHARRQQVGDEFDEDQQRDRGRFGRLEHHRVAGAQRRCELPCRHQDREVPRDDLADDAQRLVEVVGDGGLVDLGDRAFLGAQGAGEVAEMVGRERDVSVQRLADRLAVVDGLGVGEHLEVGFDAVGDLQQDIGALGRRGPGPLVGSGVRGVECGFDVLGGGACGLRVDLAADRRDDIKVLALDRGDPLAADEVVVLGLVLDLGAGFAGMGVNHAFLHCRLVFTVATPGPPTRGPERTSAMTGSNSSSPCSICAGLDALSRVGPLP